MSGPLEEYFKEHVTLPEKGQGAFSDAERAFLARYMGEDFEAALSREGLDKPARVETVAGALASGPGDEVAPASQAAGADAPPERDADAALEAGLRRAESLKLVGFRLAGQELAVPIAQVQEVLRAMPVTRLPAAPPQILGILNLRGRVVPMVDLAAIADFSGARGENRFIIVCRCREMLVGLMVETLSTMYQARGEEIEWGVEARVGVASDLVSGLLKVGEGLVAILSVDSLFQKVLKS
ncbi:CheW protein [Solidesulfovibrio fructosivorans JJ]]|uniref:CheW protein n=1 Tax=Solidesulfovibrio fructosivorans JJ] TaxID=596151 RepID=E1JWV0_SOLFR|nr:chemotaxis protein CheW [Solidesulfovibrio fructosivorans]EFL51154.1 CheW protein [Solidesulfovibrio fructosivorans JJ]]